MRKELIAQRDPKSPISEIFRTLRTNIQFMNSGKKIKSLLVTSTLPGEGKSYVASNLAITFAQSGKKVVLIDADMRKGRQYALFEVSPRPGLSNYLSRMDQNNNIVENLDIKNYIQETEIENLFIVTAGNIPPNPSELLVSEQMIDFIDKLTEVSDLVIIDGTPCALVADSIILSRIVDSTIVVTAHKQTKRDNLDTVIKNIKNVNGKIAGVVLNKVPIAAKKYADKYYYGSTSTRKRKSKNGKRPVVKKIHQENIEDTISKVKLDDLYKIEHKVDEDDEQPRAMRFNNEEEKVTDRIENPSDSVIIQEPEIDKKEEVVDPRTSDILNQINSYLDKEKSSLKKKNK